MAMTINDPAIGTRKLTDEELTDLIGTPEEFRRDMEEFKLTVDATYAPVVREKHPGLYVAGYHGAVIAAAASMPLLRARVEALEAPWPKVFIRLVPAPSK